MYYFLTASKDATLYLQQPQQNTGLDEILEVSKIYYGNLKDVSRALIKFDITGLSSSLASGFVTMSEANLLLWETESEEIPLDYAIEARPIFGKWEMGIGTRFDEISTAGVTWRYREGDSKLEWVTGSQVSASFESDGSGLGGVWYTSSEAYVSYSYQTADVEMNVMDIMNNWVGGVIPNEGFIIKYPSDKEGFTADDTNDYGILKFFGKETHTIFQPKLRIGWDDSAFATGSLTNINSDSIKITIRNFKKQYRVNKRVRFNIFARELYPLKTFSNEFVYNVGKFLPETSYYQIRDYNSNDVIIPFSDFSKLSCDETGNFMVVDFTNWETNRVYKIEFKVELDGSEHFFDDDDVFELIEQ